MDYLFLKNNRKAIIKEYINPKTILPKIFIIGANFIRLGPRALLRNIFMAMNATIWMRIVSTFLIALVDLVSFAMRKISRKQLLINLAISSALFIGGSIGWYLGGELAILISPNSTLIYIIFAFAISGVVAYFFDQITRKLISRNIDTDIDEILALFNAVFNEMLSENNLNEEQAREIAELIYIDKALCARVYSTRNRKKFATRFLSSYFKKRK